MNSRARAQEAGGNEPETNLTYSVSAIDFWLMGQPLFSYQREIRSQRGLEPSGSSIKVSNYGVWQAVSSASHCTFPLLLKVELGKKDHF